MVLLLEPTEDGTAEVIAGHRAALQNWLNVL